MNAREESEFYRREGERQAGEKWRSKWEWPSGKEHKRERKMTHERKE